MSQLDDLYAEMMAGYTAAAEELDNEDADAHALAMADALRWSARYHAEAVSVLATVEALI